MTKIERLMAERSTEEGLPTETEVRREIFCAVTECRDDGGDRIVRDVDDGHTLANGILRALEARGLLKMKVEDED
jgi:hypothetical protein